MTFLAKIKYLVHHVPAPARGAVETTAVAGGVAFVATFKPLLPALVGDPSLPTAKAALLMAATAALAAAYHAGKASLKSLAAKWAAIPVNTTAAQPQPVDPAATTNG
jgi:hypothetical protein